MQQPAELETPADVESLDVLAGLPRATATDVKHGGWKGLVKQVHNHRALVVTNHDEPEAVVMQVAEYEALVRAARQAETPARAALAALRADFDLRLAALKAPDAGNRLRNVMRAGANLNGEVKVGETY